MFAIKSDNKFPKTDKFFEKILKANKKIDLDLERLGEEGVKALSSATPVDSGKTAASWEYRIERGDGYANVAFHNTNEVDGWFNVAIMLQYGHGTRNGGYVRGIDYINPAVQPLFKELADKAWKEISSV